MFEYHDFEINRSGGSKFYGKQLEALNSLGKEGWEVYWITAILSDNDYIYHLKRLLPECTCPAQPEQKAIDNGLKHSNMSTTHEWTCLKHGKLGVKVTVT